MNIAVSNSLEETSKVAGDWLTRMSDYPHDADQACVVGLSGHLGAGKTAFVKAVANGLGVVGEVTSPTFVLMKVYDIHSEGLRDIHQKIKWSKLVHIDAYRLEHASELGALHFEDLVRDARNMIMVEWPENVGLGDQQLSNKIDFEIRDGKHVILMDI